jgi:hypothetical protein
LPLVAVQPYRIEDGCAHFSVSACDFDNLPGQINDAIAFLRASAADVTLLMSAVGGEGVLDLRRRFGKTGFSSAHSLQPLFVKLAPLALASSCLCIRRKVIVRRNMSIDTDAQYRSLAALVSGLRTGHFRR